jgi:uncharacterized membrane protein YbhN (UPF0104 family)
MAYIFIKVIPGLNGTTLLVGLGAMALGFVPMAIYWMKGSAYFKMPSKLDRNAQLLELQEMEQNL